MEEVKRLSFIGGSHHTPGPWRIRAGDVVDAQNRIVARSPRLTDDIAAGGRDDARLIAAAPDLLEALELCVRWWYDYSDPLESFERLGEWFYKETGYLRPGKSYPLDSCVPEDLEEVWNKWLKQKSSEILEAARAAIAKAKEGLA